MSKSKSKLEREFGYVLGAMIGKSFKAQKLTSFDLESFVDGLTDRFDGIELSIPEDQHSAIIAMGRKRSEELHYASNRLAGELYLSRNAERSGVTVLASGLQYEVLQPGEGHRPGPADQVCLHYEGVLIDGTVHDSSVQRGQPATFDMDKMIPGWREALQLMQVGSKWRVYLPQELAYGSSPHPNGPIAPFSALIYDLELLSII